jgi:hypothetical protein
VTSFIETFQKQDYSPDVTKTVTGTQLGVDNYKQHALFVVPLSLA